MAQRSLFVRALASTLVLAGLSGCSAIKSSFGNLLEGEKVDYKSAGKSRAPSLEVPPDLTQLQKDNRYAIPDSANRGMATASGYSMQQSSKPATGATVAPVPTNDMRVERAGNQRWLVIRQTPEALWPQIKDFWQESGFLIDIDSPEAGVMETDWAENRAKIPQDFIRNALSKALDSLYSTGERDKFRTRLERGPNGTTEVYISHRGAEEVLTGTAKDQTIWTPRAADPELEAMFLARLMTRLGAEDARAKVAVATAGPVQARAKLVKGSNGAFVQVDEGFDRAWRRVGLALDRVGFTVEDRDRAQGVYFVRYVDQAQDVNNKTPPGGFLSRVFSFGSKKNEPVAAQRYRVAVKGAESSSQVSVLNNEGRPEASQTADRILALLSDQLK